MKKKNINKKSIYGLWNHYNYVKKYNNLKYTDKDGHLYHMTGRKSMVVKYLNKLNLGKKITILELGYGAGQNAKDFMKYCKKFYGVDISAPLSKFAKNNNKRSVKSGKAKFLTGSIEEKLIIKSNSIDVIIIIGALQYVMDLEYCFKECRRVLKYNGQMIIAQSNTCIMFATYRFLKILGRYLYFILRHNPSSRSANDDSSKFGIFFQFVI